MPSACLVLCFLLTWLPAAAGAQSGAPPNRLFLVPDVEIDFDSGAANGNATIARLLSSFALPIHDRWELANVNIIPIAYAPGRAAGTPGNPEPTGGGEVFGLGDITTAGLLTPTLTGRIKWGIGPMLGMPTSTDSSLGSGKWSAGPAVRLAYQSGPWRSGMLAGNLKSFSGDSDRADFSQLIVRGLIRRELGENWFFVYSPIITANWNAPSDQRWLIPLGGGFGKYVNFGSNVGALSIQAYANVVRPEGAPDYVVRLGMAW